MTLSTAPALRKAAFATVDPDSGTVLRVIPFQFNPARLTRTIVVRDIDPEGDPAQIVRLSGPPREVLAFEAVMDATDALDRGRGPELESGLAPQLAALEMMITPSSAALIAADALADAGALELLPAPPALTLMVWSGIRVAMVRIRSLSIEENLFDQRLNPLRANVTFTVDVLSSDDLGVGTRAGGVYMAALAVQERLAESYRPDTANVPPIGAI